MIFVGRFPISSGQIRSGVISTFIVVVFDIEIDQFAEIYSQSAARVVDVLSVQRLQS